MEAPTKESLLTRAELFLEDGDWAEAARYAEKVLDIDPKCAGAYLVKAQATLQVKTPEALAECFGLGRNPDFQKALRFAGPTEKAQYEAWLSGSEEKETRIAEDKKAASAGRKSKLRPVICVVLALLIAGGAVFFFTRPKYKVGDTVTFGTYAGEPIEWQVMEDKGDGTYVLLSVKGLDAKPYNTEWTDLTWETCTLRAWLNSKFYETAFSESEKGKIVLSTVKNPDNKKYHTRGGNTTQDYVYLLSLDEVGRYFHVDPYSDDNYQSEALICLPTQTAVKNGASTISQANVDKWQSDYKYPLKAGACWWWLRSPGSGQGHAAYVNFGGSVSVYGNDVDSTDECVRPVVCARL